jgi:hypothetical protein
MWVGGWVGGRRLGVNVLVVGWVSASLTHVASDTCRGESTLTLTL